PYLQMGFAAVNVEYRLAKSSLAPAAVEDCRCALHWVFANAKKYNFDPSRVVLQGGSAGGHLVLTTGMVTPQDGFDKQCWTDDQDYWTKSPEQIMILVWRPSSTGLALLMCSMNCMARTPRDMPWSGLGAR